MGNSDSMPSSDRPILATREDIRRVELRIAELLAAVERHDRELATQLTRMGQLQADIDLIRAAWTKIRPV